MSITGKIGNLFFDKDKTKPLFPRTKISAISDESGKGLEDILRGKIDIDNIPKPEEKEEILWQSPSFPPEEPVQVEGGPQQYTISISNLLNYKEIIIKTISDYNGKVFDEKKIQLFLGQSPIWSNGLVRFEQWQCGELSPDKALQARLRQREFRVNEDGSGIVVKNEQSFNIFSNIGSTSAAFTWRINKERNSRFAMPYQIIGIKK